MNTRSLLANFGKIVLLLYSNYPNYLTLSHLLISTFPYFTRTTPSLHRVKNEVKKGYKDGDKKQQIWKF